MLKLSLSTDFVHIGLSLWSSRAPKKMPTERKDLNVQKFAACYLSRLRRMG